MFTGLIQKKGQVESLVIKGKAGRIVIDCGDFAADTQLGDSIAVNGTCLSICDKENSRLSFDVMVRTLEDTSLGELKSGTAVNLEKALRLSDRLGGHMVSGHVDATATLAEINEGKDEDGGLFYTIVFSCAKALTDQMIPKGSVAIDGISLTIMGLSDGKFDVSLIPVTLAETNLGEKAVGHLVNIELDLIGKYVKRLLTNYQ